MDGWIAAGLIGGFIVVLMLLNLIEFKRLD